MNSRSLALAALVLVAAGCAPRPHLPPQGPLDVPVSYPVEREVTDSVDFTGRTDAVNSVDVRPRVTGYLVGMPFKEGDEVKKDALLFEIDPRPYKAKLDRAMGDVALQEAKYKLAIADNVRAKNIYKMNPGAISQQDLDKYQAAENEAKAAVDASKANSEVDKLNLEWCKVLSPIDGKISRYFFTLGNLVNQDMTVLTTIVSVDPMYVYFDADENTRLRVIRAINSGQLAPLTPGKDDIPVSIGLPGEEGYPHDGNVNFVNNKVDPLTGTITVRGEFKNPASKEGKRLLTPGMFVRVRLPISKPHKALLVAQSAIGTNQGLKFVYVVDAENKVQTRYVQTGAVQPDGLQVIESKEIRPDDRIIVSGLQLVKPQAEVKPELVPMPTTEGGDRETRRQGDKETKKESK